ncbi:MAG: MEMO1 family protein [Halobacteria archaeon]
MVRRPAVAGSFYPADRAGLRNALARCFEGVVREPRSGLRGAVVPHAGYAYSGAVAARAYARLPPAETFVVVGPNHRGRGSGVAVSTVPWETPLGVAEPDLEFIEALPREIIDADEVAHRREHSLEVQLPFLQILFGSASGGERRQVRPFRFVAVAMALQDAETAREVAGEIRAAREATGRRIVVIASSDFTHYEPEATARARDTPVLDAVARGDAALFYRRMEESGASLCGFGAIGVLLNFLPGGEGRRKIELLEYATSGDVTGDRSDVVAYAAVTAEG